MGISRRMLSAAIIVAAALVASSSAQAQRFEKEIALLDMKTMDYSDVDMKAIVSGIGFVASSIAQRTDVIIKQAQEILDEPKKSSEPALKWAIRDCNHLETEINTLINVLPAFSVARSGPNKKKADHLLDLLFSARSELGRNKDGLEALLYKSKG